jgi:hypothetical protein
MILERVGELKYNKKGGKTLLFYILHVLTRLIVATPMPIEYSSKAVDVSSANVPF